MGLGEAKNMIIICGVILIITNIFAINVQSLGALQGVSGSVIDDVYDIDTGKLTGQGSRASEWIDASASGDVEAPNIFDFAFTSWSWVQNSIKMIWIFITAPYQLVARMTEQYCNATITMFCFLKHIIGFIWTMFLSITLIQAVWGR